MTTRLDRQQRWINTRIGRIARRRGAEVLSKRAHHRAVVPILPVRQGEDWRDGDQAIITALSNLRDDIDAVINQIAPFIDDSGRMEAISPNLEEDLDTRYRSRIRLGVASEVTISSGAIYVTRTHHRVDTESDASTDNLDVIDGGVDGDLLILRTVDNGRDVTVRDSSVSGGNVELDAGAAFTMNNTLDRIVLIFDGANDSWVELARANNGV